MDDDLRGLLDGAVDEDRQQPEPAVAERRECCYCCCLCCCFCCRNSHTDLEDEQCEEGDEEHVAAHNAIEDLPPVQTEQPEEDGDAEILYFDVRGPVQATDRNTEHFEGFLKKYAEKYGVDLPDSFVNAAKDAVEVADMYKKAANCYEVQQHIDTVVQSYLDSANLEETRELDTTNLPLISIEYSHSVLKERIKRLVNESLVFFGSQYATSLDLVQDKVREVLSGYGVEVAQILSKCLRAVLRIESDEQLADLLSHVQDIIKSIGDSVTAKAEVRVKEVLEGEQLPPEAKEFLTKVMSSVSKQFELLVSVNRREMLRLQDETRTGVSFTIAAFSPHFARVERASAEVVNKWISPLKSLPQTYKALLVVSASQDDLPKALTLLKAVAIGSQPCFSVHYHQGTTYVGCYEGTVQVVEGYIPTKTFSVPAKNVNAIRVYNNRLYLLCCTGEKPAFKVCIYDLSGNYMDEWPLTQESFDGFTNQLTIVSGQLVIPEITNGRLAVYSVDGQLMKRVSCTMSNLHTSICTFGTDSIIVADEETSTVCRVNISTGQTLWARRSVLCPRAVTSYGSNYVCVAGSTSDDKSIINILDAAYGFIVGKLADDTGHISGLVCDLDISESGLVVADYLRKEVLFYRFET